MKNAEAGPVVLMVHGMWSVPSTLEELEQAFINQGYCVESLCLPYHMSKEKHDACSLKKLASTRLEDYVDFIVARIRQLDQPPILVGHSMGALLAQLAAAQVQCERLVLLSSAAPAGINGLGVSVIRTLGANLLRFPLWKNVTEVTLPQVAYGIANAQSPELQKHIADNCTYESGMATFQISMGPLLLARSAAYVDFSRIGCPVLIVGGMDDRITPIGIQRKIARHFGEWAELVEIPGCCHWTVGGRYLETITGVLFSWLGSRRRSAA